MEQRRGCVRELPAKEPKMVRVGAQDFASRVERAASSIYRPRHQVLRMLTVGETLGVGEETAMLMLPLEANIPLVQAVRNEYQTIQRGEHGFVLTPPVGELSPLQQLLPAVVTRAKQRNRNATVYAVLEYLPDMLSTLQCYFEAGFALVALRPLDGLTPCYLLRKVEQPMYGVEILVHIEKLTQLALLLSRGWAAVRTLETAGGEMFVLVQNE